MNTQPKNSPVATTLGTIPALENDVANQVLEQRLLQVTFSLALMREEHTRLQKIIGEKTDPKDAIPCFQRRWKDLQLRIMSVMKQYFRASNYPVNENMLSDCVIRLRKTVTILGSIFDWELVLPANALKQNEVLSINTTGLPGAYPENDLFINWLTEQRFIVVETKINPNM